MDGYTKIVICGNETGLKFGFPAIRWFSEESTKNKDAFFMPGDTFDFSVEGFAKLMQCAYRNNCLIKEVDPEYKYVDFIDWVEAATEEMMKDVLQAYIDSSIMKKAIEQAEKKTTDPLTSTPLSPSVTENSELDLGNSTG